MAGTYDIATLQRWDERIREKVEEFGLVCYPQEFDICDHSQMLNYMAYSGMPAHYPHWSYGKTYERLKTLYDYGVSGLPYEMVINTSPCLGYLMRENSLCLQILTMAHVYAHNDFFRNNFTFRNTGADMTIERLKAQADRVRSYIEAPSIGADRVEGILDAAHALAMQCRRNTSVRKLSRDEQVERAIAASRPLEDPFAGIHRRRIMPEPDLHKLPLDPDEDILLFIRDYNPRLTEWERDLLTIAHEEAQYFIPQIETKIMNEGWASYWHREIMNSLDLPPELHLEFLVRHNQVVRPIPGDINPYHVGLRVWDEIRRRFDEPTSEEIDLYGRPDMTGRQKMFEVREADRDVSFLRRFLTEPMMRELDLFMYQPEDTELVITKVADQQNWRAIKELLLRTIGMGSVPVLRITDADHQGRRILHIRHDHDGRDLQMEYAEKCLGFIYRLWGRGVVFETVLDGANLVLSYDDTGFTSRPLR